MTKRRPIRDKLLLGGLLVGVMVAVLSASSFLGVYSYRRLVRALSCRAAELPRASQLGECVGMLRLAHAQALASNDCGDAAFLAGLGATAATLEAYRLDLAEGELAGTPFGDRTREHDTARRIADRLAAVDGIARQAAATEDGTTGRRDMLVAVGPHLEQLAALTAELPSFLQQSLHDLASEVRTRYRTLIVATWASASAACMLLAALGVLTYRWVFRPLKLLSHGSRRVAAGDFAYRIRLDTHDEMAELADALDDMTERFQEIRDDLDRQVQ